MSAASLPQGLRGVPPALTALACHLPALGLTFIALWGAVQLQLQPSWPAAALLEGGLAAALARLLGLPGWWGIINLVFAPLLLLASGLDLAPAWYLSGFLLLLLTSLGAVSGRIPLYLSSPKAWRAVGQRLPRPNAKVIDLGCGLGGLLHALANDHPGCELHGVETAPVSWLLSKWRLGRRATIRLASLWNAPLSEFDLVYAYLSPEPMPALWDKVRAEMRPGSLFISNTFAVPGAEPDEIVELDDLSGGRLLIWRI